MATRKPRTGKRAPSKRPRTAKPRTCPTCGGKLVKSGLYDCLGDGRELLVCRRCERRAHIEQLKRWAGRAGDLLETAVERVDAKAPWAEVALLLRATEAQIDRLRGDAVEELAGKDRPKRAATLARNVAQSLFKLGDEIDDPKTRDKRRAELEALAWKLALELSGSGVRIEEDPPR